MEACSYGYLFLVHQIKVSAVFINMKSNSYTMACPPVREDNPRALGGQTWYKYVYHLHQCRPYTSRDSVCLSWMGGIKLCLTYRLQTRGNDKEKKQLHVDRQLTLFER